MAPGHVPSEAYVPLSDNMVSCPPNVDQEDRKLYKDKVRVKEMGNGWRHARSGHSRHGSRR